MIKGTNSFFTILFTVILLIILALAFNINAKESNSDNQASIVRDTASVWIAPKSASKTKNPLKGIEEATKEGSKLFDQNCSECHGISGKGNGPTADMLDTKPANLTSSKLQKQSDGALFWKISTGKGVMASYKNVLKDEQIWQLVNYIRQLGKKNK
jgi:mono/diheme cytochrome c family protein